MKFSIIIPLRQISNYVREAMPYFQKQTYKDFEIIIVSEEKVKEKFEKTKIVVVGQISPAEKRNMGVENAKGEIIVFIDDDAYPEKDWLERAKIFFEDKEIIAVGGPSLIPKNATFFQRTSSKVYELSSGKTGIRYGKGKKKEIDDWPTCNFFVRKKYFRKVGGFDEKYWGGEDTQLCYSLLKSGKIIYDPETVIYHHPRKKLSQHIRQTFFWGMWRGFFMRLSPQSLQLVFFVPALLIIWILLGGIISLLSRSFAYIYLFSFLIYSFYLILLGIKSKSIKLFFPVIALSIITHLAYGLGFLRGISSKNEPIKKTLNPSEGLKIKKN